MSLIDNINDVDLLKKIIVTAAQSHVDSLRSVVMADNEEDFDVENQEELTINFWVNCTDLE